MSAAVSCQDGSFVGGRRYDCPYSTSTSADTVDVSKETMVSFWSVGPPDNRACQHESPQQDIFGSVDYQGQPESLWTDSLSPHLLRNKQLQDTLMQREEELARLHEENSKLKQFLSLSYVKSLEKKTKTLLSCQTDYGRRSRKRIPEIEGRLYASRLLSNAQSKRTCRNISLEFCSPEELAETPPTDSWILQTLGLMDHSTVDPPMSQSTSRDSCMFYTSTSGACAPCHPNINADVTAYYSPIPGCSAGIMSPTHGSVTAAETLHSQCECHSPHYRSMDSSLSQEIHTPHHPQPDGAHQRQYSPLGGGIEQCSLPHTPRTPRTDLAFSMSLNPSSSVKTHSFPQGQAFIRRDLQGGWNFTWVPRHVC